MLIHMK